jgi:hypothetical protein
MTAIPITLDTGRAACNDPAHLPLVDAAFAKPGGTAAQEMKRTLCRTCPVAQDCFEWGMTHAEVGIWGGLSPNARTRAGAPNHLPVVPDYLHRGRTEGIPAEQWRRKTTTPRAKPTGPRQPSPAAALCAQLGIRESDARRWAHEQGLVASNKGRVSLATVQQYAAAHPGPTEDHGRPATPDA